MDALNTITLQSPAKINLCLSVLGRRADGYHDVEMLMQMVGLFDDVTVSLGGRGISVTCDSHAVPSGEGNIAWKAVSEMLRISGKEVGLAVKIKKTYPWQPGSVEGAVMPQPCSSH